MKTSRQVNSRPKHPKHPKRRKRHKLCHRNTRSHCGGDDGGGGVTANTNQLAQLKKRVIERQEALRSRQRQHTSDCVKARNSVDTTYNVCKANAKKEYKKRLLELKTQRDSNLKRLGVVCQEGVVKLSDLNTRLNNEFKTIVTLQQQHQGSKKRTQAVTKSLLDSYLTPITLDIKPHVEFKNDQFKNDQFNSNQLVVTLSKVCVGGLIEVIVELGHRCFSSDIAGIVASYAQGRSVFKGEPSISFKGHAQQYVSCVAELDNRRVAIANTHQHQHGKEVIRVCDSWSGETLLELEGHTRVITCMVGVSGNRLLSGSFDGTLRLWGLGSTRQKRRCIRVFRDDRLLYVGVYSVCTFTDSKGVQMVASGNDDEISIWNLNKGTHLRTLEGHTEAVKSVSVSRDGRMLESRSFRRDRTVRLWDIDTYECKEVFSGFGVWTDCAILLNEGGLVVTGHTDNTLQVWDVKTKRRLKVLKGHTRIIWSAAFTDDGQIVSGSMDGTLRVWDVQTGECLKVVSVGYRVRHVCCLSDGRIISAQKTVQIWE